LCLFTRLVLKSYPTTRQKHLLLQMLKMIAKKTRPAHGCT
jgi:hypothetical protein